MSDDGKTREQMMKELVALRQRITELEVSETERKHAEERIDFLASILEHAPFAVVCTDDNGEIIYVNRAVERLFGYTKRELIGKNPIIFNAEPNTAEIQRDILSTVLGGKVWRGELLNKKKNGELLYIGMNIYRLRDEKGNLIALVGFMRDVTERKQMEQETERFRTVADNANYGISMVALDNKFIYSNKAYAKMHGYKVDELIGKEYKELYSKEQLPVILRLNDQLLQTGSFVNEEVWHSKKDGAIFPTLMNAWILNDDNGKPLYKVGIILDITGRKQAEDE